MHIAMPFTSHEQGYITSCLEEIYESPSVEEVMLVIRDDQGQVTSFTTENPLGALMLMLERAVDLAAKHDLSIRDVVAEVEMLRKISSN